jgi:hypothetical protein
MTTGFQQQHHDYEPILKTAAKPQQVGAKLKPSEPAPVIPAEPRSFSRPITTQ